jgi:hypothetical protein
VGYKTRLSGGTCGLPLTPIRLIFAPIEFVLMNSTLWNDQNVFLITSKIQMYPKKTPLFLTNKALIPIVGGRDH